MTTTEFPSAAARAAAAAALAEDASGKDITTVWSVPEELVATAEIRTRQSGIAAGLPVVAEVFAQVDPEVKVEAAVADGARLADGQVLVHLSGSARSLITGERTALNFLQRMCGIATLTDRYVQAVAGTRARILDTRKTAPGLRALDKYAVTAAWRPQPPPRSRDDGPAQGEPHRRGGRGDRRDRGGQARDGAHRADRGERCRGADRHTGRRGPRRRSPLDHARQHAGGRHRAGREVRASRADASRILLEASGTIRLDTVLAIAGTGVDLISVGALTHSAPALDLTMLLTTGPVPCPR